MLDVAWGALAARLQDWSRHGPRLLPWILLVLGGAVIGWLNFHASDDVQPVAAALLLFGGAFGLYRPGRAWLFAALLFLAVPLSGAWADAVSYHPGLLRPHPLYESAVALIPALLGAYTGAGIRWLSRA